MCYTMLSYTTVSFANLLQVVHVCHPVPGVGTDTVLVTVNPALPAVRIPFQGNIQGSFWHFQHQGLVGLSELGLKIVIGSF